MAIKINLEKAYYKLEWSFIREMLMRINLPQDLSQLIMSCITSVSTSILFNRGTLESFHPSRVSDKATFSRHISLLSVWIS